MNNTNGNDQAFPVPGLALTDDSTSFMPVYGLTKREWFAGMALSGLLSLSDARFKSDVNEAVLCADLLIERLNKAEASL